MIKNYQTAIVTGASHGIGPYIVRALAQEGMNLVLAARSADELEQVATAADIRATGVHVLTVPTDVTDRDALSALGARCRAHLWLSGCAGQQRRRATSNASFTTYTADDVETLIRLNLTAPIELTRLLLPGMLERKQGHIVNISSMGGRVGFPYTEVYSACQRWSHRLYPCVAGRLSPSWGQQFRAHPRPYRRRRNRGTDDAGGEHALCLL